MRHSMFFATARIAAAVAAILAGLTAGYGFGDPALAANALLMEGRQSLYQRIITKPGARLLAAGADGAEVLVDAVPSFSIYYVFARQDGFVQIGPNVTGTPKGWIRESLTVDWKQSIVVGFNNRAEAGRERQLFFADRDALAGSLENEAFASGLAALRRRAVDGQTAEPVVAVEPETMVDLDQNFYLFPILSFEPAFLPFGQEGNFLEVASVTSNPSAGEAEDFRAGISFVLDTTRSMQPYIDETKAAITRIQDQLTRSDVGDGIRFGLVGFRQDPAADAALGYHVKTFLPVSEESAANRFVEAIGSVTAATVSTPSFDEDAIGGVYEALQSSDWSRFQARVVVLVTDAGPRLPVLGHTFAGDIGIDQLAALAERKGVRLFVVHLKTPDGRPDHDMAESAYTQLSMREGASSYIAVEDGRLDRFTAQLDGMTATLVNVIRAAREGGQVEAADDSRGAQLMARAGRAMQLEYLGTRSGETAPDFFRAWTTDKAPEDPRIAALDIRIMMTRNQLSTLAEALRPIVEEGEAPGSQTDPMAFFTRVQELSARANNDLRQIDDDTRLGPVLGEYLDGLPYRSFILGLTAQDWVTLNRAQQRDVILQLKSKLAFYARVHNTPDRWIRLDPDASEGEMVTLVPLYQLP